VFWRKKRVLAVTIVTPVKAEDALDQWRGYQAARDRIPLLLIVAA